MTSFAVLGDLALHGLEVGTGVRWVVSRDRFSGWDDGAASTVSAQRKPRSNGAWTGAANLAEKHIVIGGTVSAPSEDALTDARDRLKAACSLAQTVLTINEGASSRWMSVQREDEVSFTRLSPTKATWSIQLLAPDPRKFGDELSASTGLPSSTGGVTFPLTFPVTFDAVTNSGQVSLTNTGNVAGPVRLRIDGPVTGPVVTHVGSGRSLVFSASLTLGAGERIEVDMERREVLAMGQSSRNGWVTGRGWSSFDVGPNTWSFSASTSDPGALLTVFATPPWE